MLYNAHGRVYALLCCNSRGSIFILKDNLGKGFKINFCVGFGNFIFLL